MNGCPLCTLAKPSSLVLLLPVIAAAAFLSGAIRPTNPRPAAFVPDSAAEPPVIRRRNGIPRVLSSGAPLRIVLDTVPPRAVARILWFEGRPASPWGDDAVVVDSTGTLLRFSSRLVASRPRLAIGPRRLINAAAAPDGSLWVVDDGGSLLRLGPTGTQLAERRLPFEHPALAIGADGSVWAARSTARFDFQLPTDSSPALYRLAPSEPAPIPVGLGRRPAHVLLAGLANAGHVAVSGERVFFAPFIRDELVALDLVGDTLWVASRGLPQSTDDPRFEVRDGRAVIAYHPVNLGVVAAPDDNIYVLSTAGFTTDTARLDVFDPATGGLLRTTRVDPLATLAADREGRVYQLDPTRLLAGVGEAERPAAPDYELPLLAGGRLRSADLQGRVVLVNLWASWCAPCRDEMPALDSLRRRLENPGFAFVAISEDVDVADAREFMDELGFDFQVPLGRGRMQHEFRAVGLPHTVLVDAHGRIVRQWIGYAGPEQIRMIETLVRREVAGLQEKGVASAHVGHAH